MNKSVVPAVLLVVLLATAIVVDFIPSELAAPYELDFLE